MKPIDGPHTDAEHSVDGPTCLHQREQINRLDWSKKALGEFFPAHGVEGNGRTLRPPPGNTGSRNAHGWISFPVRTVDRTRTFKTVLCHDLLHVEKHWWVEVAYSHQVQEHLLLPGAVDGAGVVESISRDRL